MLYELNCCMNLLEVNEQLFALLPGWVTDTVRVLLLVVVLTHTGAYGSKDPHRRERNSSTFSFLFVATCMGSLCLVRYPFCVA